MIELSDQGMWWLPGQEDGRVAGTLTVRADEFPRLELIGALRDIRLMAEDFSPDIILGVAGGKLVTLYRCVLAGHKVTIPGLHTEQYLAHFVLRGAHFDKASNVVFAKMAQEYDALFEWAGLSGVTVEHPTNDRGHLQSLSVGYRFPTAPLLAVDGAMVSVQPAVNMDGLAWSPRVTIEQRVALNVEPDQPIAIEAFFDQYFHDLGNFLALAVGGPVRITRMTGTLPRETSTDPARPTDVEVVFLARGSHVVRETHRWDMLFTLPDIGDEAGGALRRWLQRAETLRPIYDLYFSTLFQKGAYVHQRFLALAQGLESYHRRTVGGTHLPKETFDQLLEDIIAVIERARPSIGTDARIALVNKAKYFNEVSFRRRLKDLLNEQNELSSLLIRSRRRFIERVVNTRNYYTHYDESARDASCREGELPHISDQMQFLLELCLLSELGLEHSTIARVVRKHQRYLGLRRVLSSFDPES